MATKRAAKKADRQTSVLSIPDTVEERIRTQAAELWTKYERGEHPRVRAYSLYGPQRSFMVDGREAFEFIGVSEGVKRDGSRIAVDGIEIASLEKNPVFLFGHDYENRPPIGKLTRIWKASDPVAGKTLRFQVVAPSPGEIGEDHADFVRTVFGLYKAGFMHATSFGWAPLEMKPLEDERGQWRGFDFLRSDALEFSAVNVPADPEATIQHAIQRGLIPEKYIERFVANRGRNSAIYTVRDAIERSDESEVAEGDVADAVPQPEEQPQDVEQLEIVDDATEPTDTVEEPQDEPVVDDGEDIEPEPDERQVHARPYSVKKDHAECPMSKPWGVVKDSDGKLMGCHESEEKADKQVAALYANEASLEPDAVRRVVNSVAPDESSQAGIADVRALIAQALEPLFQEIEALRPKDNIEQRIGAVLSRKNRDKLEQAQQLIQTVLDEAANETETNSIDRAELDAFKAEISARVERLAPRQERQLYETIFRRGKALEARANSTLGRASRRPQGK